MFNEFIISASFNSFKSICPRYLWTKYARPVPEVKHLRRPRLWYAVDIIFLFSVYDGGSILQSHHSTDSVLGVRKVARVICLLPVVTTGGSPGREILDKDSGCEFTPSTASCSPPRLVESTWTLPPPLYFRLPLPILLELPSRTWTVVCRGIARGRQCWGVGPSCGGSGPLVVPWSGRIPRRRRPCPCVPCERSGSWRCGPCDSAIRVNSVE